MIIVTMTWSCYIAWWPCYDLAIIIPWRVWITMIIPCHSMIVMFDYGCQSGILKFSQAHGKVLETLPWSASMGIHYSSKRQSSTAFLFGCNSKNVFRDCSKSVQIEHFRRDPQLFKKSTKKVSEITPVPVVACLAFIGIIFFYGC